MKHIFAFLLAVALVAGGTSNARAQATAASAAPASASACPTGTKFVKGYTKKDGTAVAAYCKASKKHGAAGTMSAATSAPAAMATAAPAASAVSATPVPGSTTCPDGKSYVQGYTTKKGTKVAGYCRKAHAKKS